MGPSGDVSTGMTTHLRRRPDSLVISIYHGDNCIHADQQDACLNISRSSGHITPRPSETTSGDNNGNNQ